MTAPVDTSGMPRTALGLDLYPKMHGLETVSTPAPRVVSSGDGWGTKHNIGLGIVVVALALAFIFGSRNFTGMTKWGECGTTCADLHKTEMATNLQHAVSSNASMIEIAKANANAIANLPKVQQVVVPTSPPAIVVQQPQAPVVVAPVRPRAMAPTCGARGCGVNAAAPLPNGRCMAPANSPHAGQMGFIHPDGTCKGRPPVGRASVRYAYN